MFTYSLNIKLARMGSCPDPKLLAARLEQTLSAGRKAAEREDFSLPICFGYHR